MRRERKISNEDNPHIFAEDFTGGGDFEILPSTPVRRKTDSKDEGTGD